jgi:hypothetical protein
MSRSFRPGTDAAPADVGRNGIATVTRSGRPAGDPRDWQHEDVAPVARCFSCAGCVIWSILPLVTSGRPVEVNVAMPGQRLVLKPFPNCQTVLRFCWPTELTQVSAHLSIVMHVALSRGND